MVGFLISILTLPGIVIHEFSHEFFCRLMGVKVKKVCYFRFGNPPGYVLHEQSKYFYQAFFITIGPLILGTFLAALSFNLGKTEDDIIRKAILFWIGFSLASNCMPSSGDAKSLWAQNWSIIKRNLLAIGWVPFTLFVWIVSVIDSYIFRIFYAILLVYITSN